MAWFRSWFSKRPTAPKAKRAARRRTLTLESLENREVFAFALEIMSSPVAVPVGVNAFLDSANSDISDNTQLVVFQSDMPLLPGDTNGTTDIYMKDRSTNILYLISTSKTGILGNSDSTNPVISGDGRYVAWESNATNLVDNDPVTDSGTFTDIFRRDVTTGDVVRVTVSTTTGTETNGGSSHASISSDGRYVAFDSAANNLVTGDTNNISDVFRRDLTSNRTARASVLASGVEFINAFGNFGSVSPSISADGRQISFTTYATNANPNDLSAGIADIYTKDMTSGGLSYETNTGNGDSLNPYLSTTGRYLVFESDATTLVGTGNDNNGFRDVFFRDRQLGITQLVSVSKTNVQGNRLSDSASISSDGLYVVFRSRATNLSNLTTANDTNGQIADVYEKNRKTGDVTRFSVSNSQVQGDGDSTINLPSISPLQNSYRPVNTPDGRYLVFDTFATNIFTAADNNDSADVYFQVINAAPITAGQVLTTPQNTPLAITLTATDAENDPLTWKIVTQPQHGSVRGTLPNVTYTPANGYSGPDSFAYVVNDGHGNSFVATISITVGSGTPPPPPPPGNTNQFLIAFNAPTGQWFGSHLATGQTRVLTTWDPSANWTNGKVADFNGDGLSDIAGYANGGRWWVGLAQTGSQTPAFTTTNWGGSGGAIFDKVMVGDVNRDGKADIIGFSKQAHNSWFVMTSTGTSFKTTVLHWSPSASWTDFVVGDFNGDGRTDIAARTQVSAPNYSAWWVGTARSDGTFRTTRWTRWEAVQWRDTQALDFNGDGRDDLIGRRLTGGWRLSQSTGALFNNFNIGKWEADATAGWHNVLAADLNGDGKEDVVGQKSNGDWYWFYSSGAGKATFPTAKIGNWAVAQNYTAVFIGDFQNDGVADIFGRSSATGKWRIDTLNGALTSLVTSTSTKIPTWPTSAGIVFDALGEDDGTVF